MNQGPRIKKGSEQETVVIVWLQKLSHPHQKKIMLFLYYLFDNFCLTYAETQHGVPHGALYYTTIPSAGQPQSCCSAA